MLTDAFDQVPRFPALCPECIAFAGAPYTAEAICHASIISVGMRCSACCHEWRLQVRTLVGVGFVGVTARRAVR